MIMSLSFRYLIVAAALLSGCCRSSSETWEDVKTAGRYMQRGVDTLLGKDYESKMLTSDEEFIGPYDYEFIPLNDEDLKGVLAMADRPLPQPKGIPGEKGIPSLEVFYSPGDILRSVFQTLHFETDEHVLREKSDIETIQHIADYMKKNPRVYVMISGHCDERASASYNMALGMRRANYVRNLLVKQGADLNRIYTVSRGKEEPIALGNTQDDFKQNRRAEFRIYEK